MFSETELQLSQPDSSTVVVKGDLEAYHQAEILNLQGMVLQQQPIFVAQQLRFSTADWTKVPTFSNCSALTARTPHLSSVVNLLIY